MLIAPPLSILLGPVPAVVIAFALEVSAALVMFTDALPKISLRTLAYLTVPAAFTVPIGGYLLLTPRSCHDFRLFGVRYSGSPRSAMSLAVGSVVGVLLGATSIGAPPVILYLLSGPDLKS